MKKAMIILLIVLLASPALAQRVRRGAGAYHSEGFYLLLGGTVGPTFSDFFDHLSRTYPSSKLKNFGGNASFSIGYISRFHRNFAIDAGFSIYSLKSRGAFSDTGAYSAVRIDREFDYQAAIFTGTLPIYFEFSPGQTIVPYVGVGISIFSMRLDDYWSDVVSGSLAFRDSRVAVGGHFEAGVGFKLTSKILLDARARWHSGNGRLATFENGGNDFSIKQNVAQYGLGVDYFFR
jgi:opacity protein-like surface antigen